MTKSFFLTGTNQTELSRLSLSRRPPLCTRVRSRCKRRTYVVFSNVLRRAAVWLSQKMMEKSKEVDWRKLTEAEKKEYDEAQAVEVSNVVRERAVRALTSLEKGAVDHSKVMGMRWVLTRKASGAAKARLVVLGYQAHNLLDVDKAAPTLSRTGRNMLLAAASNAGMILETGDVTSAFLQSLASLEDEDLIVWAPAELASVFGADPANSGMLMKLTKAFYGLAHAPRKWNESAEGHSADPLRHQQVGPRGSPNISSTDRFPIVALAVAVNLCHGVVRR